MAMKFIYFLRRQKYMNNFGKIFLLIGKNISRFKVVSVDE